MMNNDTAGTGQKLFCRKCGRQLLSDSLFCSSCGANVVMSETSENQYQEEFPVAATVASSCCDEKPSSALENAEGGMAADHEISTSKPQKEKVWKVLIPVVLVILLVCAVILILPRIIPAEVEKQDINAIDGCPEFYSVKFGMTPEEASAMIKVEHRTITSYESSWGSEDGLIYLEDGAKFDLYGIPVSKVICGFDVSKMDSVLISFSKDAVSLDEIIDLYARIYGEPTEMGPLSTTWSGEKTTIFIYTFDSELTEEYDPEIVVSYDPTPIGNTR